MRKTTDSSGLTLVEVLVSVALLTVIAGLLLPRFFVYRKSPRIQCVNNLKNVGLGFRIFAVDNNDQLPGQVMRTNGAPLPTIDALRVYLMFTNLIPTPQVLCCPVDKERQAAGSMAKLQLKNISYFASLSAGASMPQAFLAGDRNLQTNGVPVSGIVPLTPTVPLSWTKEIHNDQGNVTMADGSVQLFSSDRLKQGMLDQGAQLGTNYLVMP